MDSRSYDAADQLRKSAARSKWMEAQTSTACASFDQDVVPLIRKEQVYACIRKEMGIVFFVLDVVRTQRRALLYVRLFSSCQENLGGELLGEALFLGPLVVVGRSVLLEDLGVLGDEILAAVGADGHGLSGLDGSAVLVNLDTSAGGVGLLVLAGDAVLLGDRHGER
jgi:hypothetical protein